MTNHIFATLWGEALASNDRDRYVSDWATSSLLLDPENEGDIPDDIIDAVAQIWDVAHMSIADIRKSVGMTQAQFAERLCVSRRTAEGWESRGCQDHIRLLIAENLGLIKR